MFPKLLRRDILLLLCAKTSALALIYYFFIVPEAKPGPDSVTIQAHLFGDRAR
jgi:hypothetical protein